MSSGTWKLPLILLAPAFAGLITAAILLAWLLPGPIEALTVERLLAELKVLTLLVPTEPGVDLQAWARALPAGTDLRVTLIADDGTVLAESARSEPQMEAMDNHGHRPEVRQAFAEGEGWSRRRSATTGVEYVYAARTFTDRSGRRRVLRLARPAAALAPIQLSIAAALIPAIAVALVALMLASRRLKNHLLAPLAELARGTDQIAEGRLDHRLALPENDLPRLLTQAIHRLADRARGDLSAATAERDHLRRILDRMSEGVLVVGPDGRAVLANPAFRKFFGLAEGEVAGQAPLELVRQPQLSRLIEGTLANGQAGTAEIGIERPARRTLSLASASLASTVPASTVLASTVPAGPAPGPAAGALLVVRDITAFTRLTRMRRDFVANVSHELKTPLAAIRAYAETLADGALADGETARRFVTRILAQCRRLQALLDDLLTLSRLESPDLATALSWESVFLPPLIERAVEVVAAAAQERGVRVHGGKLAPVEIRGHGESLERLVVNLLDNAVKYNRPGGQVHVSLSAGQGECILEVRDTGIGIPADSLPRLFERFYRVDKGRSRAEGGTGLGLAIVKHTTQMHGGRVEVESEERVGSTFRVHLPVSTGEVADDPGMPKPGQP